jgi:hypothetical protein
MQILDFAPWPDVRSGSKGEILAKGRCLLLCLQQQTSLYTAAMSVSCQDRKWPFHSITSSARPSNVGEIGSSSIFAVFRLITSSNLMGCSTGKSLGFAPFRILST